MNEIENHFIYNDNNINTNSFDISIIRIIIYDEFANTDVSKRCARFCNKCNSYRERKIKV